MKNKTAVKRGRRTRRNPHLSVVLAVVLIAALSVGMFLNTGTSVQAAEKTYTSDGQTLNDWERKLSTTTENIGRIWTDKSVSQGDVTLAGGGGIEIQKDQDSDFMVSLSALSTASSLTSTTLSPLDIILVLDRSGSMGENLSGGPGQRQTKMQALKDAVNSFLDQTAEANVGTAVENQHRIGIVSYARGASTDQELTACTNRNVESMKETVNDLRASGSTYADYGMAEAKSVLNNARSEAKKLVIFFTDGEPNHGDGFDNEVAADTVNTAKEIKDGNTTIYTIGVFQGADPSDLEGDFNQYMNAVSSNYPEATAEGSNGFLGYGSYFTVDWGEDSASGSYYKAATDADELSGVFDDIFDSEVTGSGAPTQVTETQGFDETNSGYITFTDTLGDYVQFDDLNTVVYGNMKFQYSGKNKVRDTTTYSFDSASVESGVYNGDIADLIVTVTDGQNGAGDVVEVKVPASLIPCRYFDVQTNDGETTVEITKEAMPIRIFYDVSLRETVVEQIMNGEADATLQAYIESHSSEGNVNFYSNKYESGDVGTTTARFTPSTGNDFYYYTKDTLLYTAQNVASPATGNYDSSLTYYYQQTYYDTADDQQKTQWITTSGLDRQFIDREEGAQLYIKAGTKKIARPADFIAEKGENNKTETASTYISPAWNDNDVIVSLGNNGRIRLELPGTLSVSKHVEAQEGFTAPSDAEFTFTLSLKDKAGMDLTGEYTAKVFDAGDQEQQSPNYKVANGDTFTLENGWYIEIYGLPAETSYTVKETAAEHYTTTNDSKEGATDTAEGAIVAGQVSEVAFTNTYGLDPVIKDTSELFEANKVLTGRAWENTDTFRFRMEAANANARRILSQTKTVTLSGAGQSYAENQEVAIDYGELTFDRPGEYFFALTEVIPDPGRIPGVSYTQAAYRVVVNVTDKDGKLEVSSALYVLIEENGTSHDDPENYPVQDKTANFTNRFSADSVRSAPTGEKVYTDNSGDKPLGLGMFTFTVQALDGAPLPAGSDPDGDGRITISNGTIVSDRAELTFELMEFTTDMVGDTYVYQVTEDIPAGAVNGAQPNTKVLNGMTYDANTYYVVVEIGHESGTDGKEIVVPVYTYCTDPAYPAQTELKTPDGSVQGTLIFRNEYNVEPLILSGDTALHGTKTIQGRDMLANEDYSFTLTGGDEKTTAAIADGTVAIVNGNTASVSGGTNGKPVGFRFGDVIFTKPGTYQFHISENVPQVNPGGVSYDNHITSVTVIVKDENGKLRAESVVYDNGQVSADRTQAVFVNTYRTSGALEGTADLTVKKIFTGRPNDIWSPDDVFTFNIAGYDGITKQAIADGRITLSKDEVTVDAYNKSENFGDIIFTEPGNYQFVVAEQQGQLKNVTYDKSQKIVTVQALDQNDGTMAVSIISVTDAATQEDTELTFTNVYEPDPVTLDGETNLKVTKVLSGRAWKDGDSFAFTLEGYAQDDATMNAIEAGDVILPENANGITITDRDEPKEAEFGDIIFKKAGEYVFAIREEQNGIGGISYDTSNHLVKVTVTDNLDGTMTAAVSEGANPTVTNTYKPDGNVIVDAADMNLMKVLKGKAWGNDAFTFVLEAESGTQNGVQIKPEEIPMPENVEVIVNAANNKDEEGNDTATFGFGPIIYETEGTYEYHVTEKAGSNSGMTYDEHIAVVTVTVTDNLNGGYAVKVDVENGTFINTYDTKLDYHAKGGLELNKKLTGRDLAAGQFEFTVTAADEVSGEKAGFDGMRKVIATTAATMDNGVSTASMDVFGGMIFDARDNGKEYRYTIAETKGGGAGYTNDSVNYAVTISVTDDGNGVLIAKTTVKGSDGSRAVYSYSNISQPDEKASVIFRNSYDASGSLGGEGDVFIHATKELLNARMHGGEFTFYVKNASGDIVSKGTNSADGMVTFDELVYDIDEMNTDVSAGNATKELNGSGNYVYTYQYTVAEDVRTLPEGVTPVAYSYQITVRVTDNGDGTLDIGVTYPEENGDMLAFVNQYGADASASVFLNGKKEIKTESGNNAPTLEEIAGKYTFALESDGAPMPEKISATNDEAGNITFGMIKYDIDDFGDMQSDVDGRRELTYTYMVTETGEVAGITNDTEVKTIIVTVTDNGDGTITAAADPTDGAKFTFTNSYHVTPKDSTPTEGDLEINKELTGRGLTEGEFSFEMKDVQGYEVASGVNRADGSVKLSAVTFFLPGTYEFSISEIRGDSGGVTYDESTYKAIAEVRDNGDGTMAVSWSATDADGEKLDTLTFRNTYEAAPASVAFGAVKRLEGRAVKDGEFKFILKDKDNKVVSEASNDDKGTVQFGILTFTEAGTYTYTISEVKGSDKTITYDDTVYELSVTVTDNGEGMLEASVDNNKAEAVFTNIYTEPKKADDTSKPGVVMTGDTSAILPAVLGMAVAILVIAAASFMIYRRRK